MLFYSYASIISLLTISYIIIIRNYMRHWDALRNDDISPDFVAQTPVSLLIAARNEAENIGNLLTALQAQTYPPELLEIIVIDDNSDDATAAVVTEFMAAMPHLRLLNLAAHSPKGGKKTAITVGIAQAKGHFIVTTDADCVPLANNWLSQIVDIYQRENPKLIAAPVLFSGERNILGKFQTLDFAGMMCITGAGIAARTTRLCNGANLAYPKAVFAEVGGYANNENLASGDDMFLLHKIAAQYPDSIRFLKSNTATILTEPKHDWRDFVAQRLRWGTKNTQYSDWRVTAVLGAVWLFSVSFFVTTALLPLFYFYNGLFGVILWLFPLMIKYVTDFVFLRKMCIFFNRKDLLTAKIFLPSFFVHLYYLAYIGLLANFRKKYVWKARVLE